MPEICHCGQPLHYTCGKTEIMVKKMVADKGRFVEVVCDGIRYAVDRHYIALHGLEASELKTGGFKVVGYENE